jgi:hypothetical protein
MKNRIYLTFSLLIAFVFTAFAQNLSMSGQVVYDMDSEPPLPFVTVKLYYQETLVDVTLTDTLGFYRFEQLYPGEYTMVFSYNEPWMGCDMDDAARVVEYLNQQISFTDLQFEAADVDNDGIITTADLTLIVNRYMQTNTSFPAGDWVFEDSGVSLDLPEGQTHKENDKKRGRNSGDTKSGENIVIVNKGGYLFSANTTDILEYRNNEIIEYPVYANEDLMCLSLGFAIAFPNANIEILELIPQLPSMRCAVDGNLIKAALISLDGSAHQIKKGDVLFVIRGRVKNLNSDTRAGFSMYRRSTLKAAGEEREIHFGISLPQLRLASAVASSAVEMYPNPAKDHIKLLTHQKNPSTLSIIIHNSLGQEVQQQKYVCAQGYNEIHLNLQALPKGIYFVSTQSTSSGNEAQVHRLIIQ